MVKFSVGLSAKEFEKLIKNLTEHGKKLEAAKEDILMALADYVYERIMFYVPVDTGRLKQSFIKEFSHDIAKVYTDLYYAKYVEFGTGISGKQSEYNSKYISEKAYNLNYTGQPAQKFVYQAVLDVENNYIEIVKSVLREKGLI